MSPSKTPLTNSTTTGDEGKEYTTMFSSKREVDDKQQWETPPFQEKQHNHHQQTLSPQKNGKHEMTQPSQSQSATTPNLSTGKKRLERKLVFHSQKANVSRSKPQKKDDETTLTTSTTTTTPICNALDTRDQ
eukprot:7717197-Ditylum_brightwellii.AAC.1